MQGIIAGSFGETAGALLQTRYVQMADDKRTSPKNKLEVRYTNARMKADDFIKSKNSFDWSSTQR